SSRSLSRLVGGLGNIDDLLPLLALAGLVLIHPPETTWGWPGWVLVLAGLSLGAVLGVTVAALFGVRLDRTELWPVLLGASLLVVGITLRLELPVLTPLFLLGACVALFSGHREMIRNLVVQTERPLLLPTLLLAGALVELPRSGGEWVLVFGAVASRVVFQFVGGLWISRFFDEARGDRK